MQHGEDTSPHLITKKMLQGQVRGCSDRPRAQGRSLRVQCQAFLVGPLRPTVRQRHAAECLPRCLDNRAHLLRRLMRHSQRPAPQLARSRASQGGHRLASARLDRRAQPPQAHQQVILWRVRLRSRTARAASVSSYTRALSSPPRREASRTRWTRRRRSNPSCLQHQEMSQ